MSPKPPRRKTTKKPSRRAPAPRRLPLPAGVIPRPFSNVLKIIEIKNGEPSLNTVRLHRHVSLFQPDRVQWVNLDPRGRTVVFKDDLWPFVQPPQDILVPAYGYSPVFTVYFNATEGNYHYVILPPEEVGPGEPQIVVDP
jgi:hypothetical protein